VSFPPSDAHLSTIFIHATKKEIPNNTEQIAPTYKKNVGTKKKNCPEQNAMWGNHMLNQNWTLESEKTHRL